MPENAVHYLLALSAADALLGKEAHDGYEPLRYSDPVAEANYALQKAFPTYLCPLVAKVIERSDS